MAVTTAYATRAQLLTRMGEQAYAGAFNLEGNSSEEEIHAVADAALLAARVQIDETLQGRVSGVPFDANGGTPPQNIVDINLVMAPYKAHEFQPTTGDSVPYLRQYQDAMTRLKRLAVDDVARLPPSNPPQPVASIGGLNSVGPTSFNDATDRTKGFTGF